MTIDEVYRKIAAAISNVYDEREAANISNLVVEHFTGLNKLQRITNKQAVITSDQSKKIEEGIIALQKHKPVQYVLEEAWFAGLRFFVNEDVLIPRPETEELVEWIVTDAKKNSQQISVIDIGTGSGCIPVAIKKRLPLANTMAVDVSAGALAVAAANAKKHDANIQLQQVDFLAANDREALGTFDVIVSNPPYIKRSEERTMNENVLAYEPHVALFVPDDNALVFYEALAHFSTDHLVRGGALYVEINESLGNEVVQLFTNLGFDEVVLRKDMQGKDRMVRARGRM